MSFGSLRMFRLPMRRGNDDERILPLINVVFLLLIFFMLAGRIATGDRIPVQPPLSQSEARPAGRDLTILVAADGKVALDGQLIPADGLGAAIGGRARNAPDLAVRIKADQAADAVQVVRILGVVRSAGVERAHLLTRAGR